MLKFSICLNRRFCNGAVDCACGSTWVSSVMCLFILCVALWLLAAGHLACFVLAVVVLLSFVDVVSHFDYLIGKKRADYFAFFWFVVHVLSVIVCLLSLLVPLIGSALWLWLFLDIFYTILYNKRQNNYI